MIAIDWSHTKDLTTYDGKKLRVEGIKALLKRIGKDGVGEESIGSIKSNALFHSPISVVLEQGCPLSIVYKLVMAGSNVFTIDNMATQVYRMEHNIEKTDKNDAKIIYELANDGAKLQAVDLTDDAIQLYDLYHQYCRYQKARVSMSNMRMAHKRHFGDSDLLAYDISIDTLQAREKGLLKQLTKLSLLSEMPKIKGLGKRIWVGLVIMANPQNFKCLSAYLRYCGLKEDVIISHKYSRHAKMLYHLLAEEILRVGTQEDRAIYDKCKADIIERHSDYTKLHIHNAALNRTATFLAKRIYQYCVKGGR